MQRGPFKIIEGDDGERFRAWDVVQADVSEHRGDQRIIGHKKRGGCRLFVKEKGVQNFIRFSFTLHLGMDIALLDGDGIISECAAVSLETFRAAVYAASDVGDLLMAFFIRCSMAR